MSRILPTLEPRLADSRFYTTHSDLLTDERLLEQKEQEFFKEQHAIRTQGSQTKPLGTFKRSDDRAGGGGGGAGGSELADSDADDDADDDILTFGGMQAVNDSSSSIGELEEVGEDPTGLEISQEGAEMSDID